MVGRGLTVTSVHPGLIPPGRAPFVLDAERFGAFLLHYLPTLGTRIVEGRHLDSRLDAAGTVVVGESLARSLTPGRSLVGATVWVNGPASHVAGIAEDVRANGPEHPPDPVVYVLSPSAAGIVIRTDRRRGVLTAVSALVERVTDGDTPPLVHSAEDEYARVMRFQRAQALTLGLAAGVGMVFGFIGIVTTANEIAHRQLRECAVRTALGATPVRVTIQAIGRLLAAVAAGIVLGLGAGVLAGGAASTLWFGVRPADWLSLTFVAAAAVGLCLLAALRPARMIASSNPSRLLHES